ncbi:TetR/AcrR family transcriptional regulator [Streptacidiphilus sp. 4-A2]|nr:TetR/AcrR family transcriptional regulator [Streptacidiphilus sp. 4-A2]
MANTRPETRSKVLRTAAALFRRQGYHGTGLNQLLSESKAPKGSLYFHFPGGKEQLAAEAVTLAAAELGAQMREALEHATDPATAIVTVGNLFAGQLAESGYRDGCPIATVAMETSGDNEQIRESCSNAYGAWLAGLTLRIHGWGVPQDEAAPLAELVLSGIQGALLLAKVQQDCTPIHQVTARLGTLVAASVRAA